MTVTNSSKTHYEILHIPQTASTTEIKAAYHRVLLSTHPDKKNNAGRGSSDFDVSILKDAYRTLMDTELRASYDASLLRENKTSFNNLSATGPRPAQVISLEEFVVIEDGDVDKWHHGCRCGGNYEITELDLEDDRHLIACDLCSEVVYVGYDVLEDGEDEI